MVYAVMAQLGYRSANLATGDTAKRDSLLTQFTSRLSGRPKWGVDQIEAGEVSAARWGYATATPVINIAVRFTSKADQAAVRADIESFLDNNQRRPVDLSWVSIHDCVNDESHPICPLPDRWEWQGGVLVDV